jgi:hypothetical protein
VHRPVRIRHQKYCEKACCASNIESQRVGCAAAEKGWGVWRSPTGAIKLSSINQVNFDAANWPYLSNERLRTYHKASSACCKQTCMFVCCRLSRSKNYSLQATFFHWINWWCMKGFPLHNTEIKAAAADKTTSDLLTGCGTQGRTFIVHPIYNIYNEPSGTLSSGTTLAFRSQCEVHGIVGRTPNLWSQGGRLVRPSVVPCIRYIPLVYCWILLW